jgi:hypothetical protein
MTSNYRAAWVPESLETDWETAVELAVEWVEAECADQDAGAVLVTVARDSGGGVRSLAAFARRHHHTTPLSHERIKGVGPVLVYCPDPKTFAFAADLAHGSSLCVVEGFGTAMRGWAREVGAVDLTTGESSTQEELDPRLAKALHSLEFYGNNAWGDQFGKQQARRILADLRDAGLLDAELISGAMQARGRDSARAIKQLGKLMEEALRRR